MLITDYTIEWINPWQATLSWAGGSTDYWWTVYIDGKNVSQFYGSGSIEKTITAEEDKSHSIAIVRHDIDDEVVSPEASKLLQPTIRWVVVDNTYRYQIVELDDDDNEYTIYEVYTYDGSTMDVLSWQFPMDIYQEGLDNVRFRVYAYGSFGVCATPNIINGFTCGHPEFADTYTVEEDSSGDLLLYVNA